MNVRQSLFYALLQRYFTFILQFISNIIISRLLLPEEIGVFSLSLAALSIIQVMREFGISRYLIQEKHLSDDIIRTAFGLMIVISLSFALGVFAARDVIAEFYNRPELSDIILVLLINFFILPFGQPAYALLSRDMEFRKTLYIGMASVTVHSVVGVGCAFYGFSSMSLAYASVAGTLVTSVLSLAMYPTHIKLRPSLKEWRRILSYGIFATLSSIVGTAGGSSAEIVMGKVLTFTAVGLYSRANGLITVFQVQLIQTLSRVAFSGFAKLIREGEKIEGRYLRALSYITGFLWPIYVVLGFAAEALIVFLFGEVWADSAPVARILCLNGMVVGCYAMLVSVYNAHGAVRRQLANESIVQSIRILLVILAAPYGLAAVAWAQVASSVLNGILLYHMIRPLFAVRLREFLRALWRSAVVAAITLAATAAAYGVLAQIPHAHLTTLIVSAIVGLASWIFGIWLTGHVIGPEIVLWLRKGAAALQYRRTTLK